MIRQVLYFLYLSSSGHFSFSLLSSPCLPHVIPAQSQGAQKRYLVFWRHAPGGGILE